MTLTELERKHHTRDTLKEPALELIPVTDAWMHYPRLTASILLTEHDAHHLTEAFLRYSTSHEMHWWSIVKQAQRRRWGTRRSPNLSADGEYWRLNEHQITDLLRHQRNGLPTRAFLALSKHPSTSIRCLVAKHRKIPKLAAERLANDPNRWVCMTLYSNDSVPKSVRDSIRCR
jgi:hypothetical protein